MTVDLWSFDGLRTVCRRQFFAETQLQIPQNYRKHDGFLGCRGSLAQLTEKRILLRCLAKDPNHRFQNVGSLERTLARSSVAGQWIQEKVAAWWQSAQWFADAHLSDPTITDTVVI